MSRVRAHVDIAAPVEEVFAFFDDLDNAVVLVPSLAEVTLVEPLPGGGRRVEYETFGRDGTRHTASSEHVVFDPPHRTVTRAVQSGVEATTTREFRSLDGGTRVEATIAWDVPIRYVAGIVSAPLRGPYRRALREGLDGARAAIEGG